LNKLTFILIVSLFACQQTDYKTIAFLNEGLERCNREIKNLNNKISTDILVADIVNPARNHFFKLKSDSLIQKSENILQLVSAALSENWSESYSEENFKSVLNDSLSEYLNLIKRIFPKDTFISQKIEILKTFNEASLTKNQKPGLILLENKIRIIENAILSYFYARTEQARFAPDKIEIAVIPKNKYLKGNDIFEARLYLISYNSKSSNTSVFIDNEKMEIKNGKALFVDSAFNKPGYIKKEGVLIHKNKFSDFSKEFPFALTYQIMNK